MCLPLMAAAIPALTSLGPATLAALAFGTAALGAGVGVMQERANAKATEAYQKRQYEQTRASATASAISQYNALLARQQQETAVASQAIDTNAARAAAAMATARTTAGQAGAAGQSVSALLGEYRMQELGFQQTNIRNMTWANAQIKLNMEGIRANQQAQIAAAAPKPVPMPDYLGAALRIGGSFMDATANYANWAGPSAFQKGT